MSVDASALEGSMSTADYDYMLAAIDSALEEALYKIEGDGRLTDVKREKVRVDYLRAIGYLVGQRRQVAQDRNLEELAERIDRLEQDVRV